MTKAKRSNGIPLYAIFEEGQGVCPIEDVIVDGRKVQMLAIFLDKDQAKQVLFAARNKGIIGESHRVAVGRSTMLLSTDWRELELTQ